MARSHLTPEQAERAEQIFQSLRAATEADLRALAELLARKQDRELLGATEFEVRDRVHTIGAKAIEAAVNGRKERLCSESRPEGPFDGDWAADLIAPSPTPPPRDGPCG